LADGQIAQHHIANPHPLQTHHFQANLLAHAADLAFLAFGQHKTQLLRVLYCIDIKLRCSYNVSMNSLRFEWDSQKAAVNAKKHGVSFEEAKSVFSDDNGKLIGDPGHSEDEDRFVLLGLSSTLRLLLVCHCYRAEGNIIRIISARKASAKESQTYP
jgi:uncharacterized protein